MVSGLRATLAVAIILLPILTVASASGPGGGDSMPIKLVKASCRAQPNGTTIVNILVELPNPGYKLARKKLTVIGDEAVVSLEFEPPSGPVIQVISMWGTTITVNGSINRITITINNKTVYSGGCGQEEATSSLQGSLEPGKNSSTGMPSTSGLPPSGQSGGNKGITAGLAGAAAAVLVGIALRVLAKR